MYNINIPHPGSLHTHTRTHTDLVDSTHCVKFFFVFWQTYYLPFGLCVENLHDITVATATTASMTATTAVYTVYVYLYDRHIQITVYLVFVRHLHTLYT